MNAVQVVSLVSQSGHAFRDRLNFIDVNAPIHISCAQIEDVGVAVPAWPVSDKALVIETTLLMLSLYLNNVEFACSLLCKDATRKRHDGLHDQFWQELIRWRNHNLPLDTLFYYMMVANEAITVGDVENLLSDDFILPILDGDNSDCQRHPVLWHVVFLFIKYYTGGGKVPHDNLCNLRRCVKVKESPYRYFGLSYSFVYFTNPEHAHHRISVNLADANSAVVKKKLFNALVSLLPLRFPDLVLATICVHLYAIFYKEICERDRQLFVDLRHFLHYMCHPTYMRFIDTNLSHFDNIYRQAVCIAARMLAIVNPRRH